MVFDLGYCASDCGKEFGAEGYESGHLHRFLDPMHVCPFAHTSGIYHRVVYAFYFINVDPGLALGIPMVITFIAPYSLRAQRYWLLFWLAAALVFFIVFFPIHPADFINGS